MSAESVTKTSVKMHSMDSGPNSPRTAVERQDSIGATGATPQPVSEESLIPETSPCSTGVCGGTDPILGLNSHPNGAAESGQQNPSTTGVHGIHNPGFVDEPPPYTPPDPKTVHLLYPPFQPLFPGQEPMVCQPGPTEPVFYQQQFIPSANYPYTIYMNGHPAGPESRSVPKDYLVESVLVMVFCCLMTGVVALVYSHETRTAISRGDFAQAERASLKARSLVLFSLLFGVFISVSWVIYVVVVVLSAV
ncbi:proline rich transmembrane protein 1B isoform X1 [Acipenser ruthenus]|uniref:proline rich transmembrane protein 1B isoform X1 n=2 Tax=Acipenser ruthenus TaxID=7906 RepID=UPI002740EE15|nr:proline rich transmembrane protein 1B isoform X1 [Acipenser ruthenus]